MLIDTHCHLDQFKDPGNVLDRAAERGVRRVVAVSEDPESARAALGLKERFPGRVLAGVGLHPAWVVRNSHEDVEQGLGFLAENMAGADVLGEVGLDFKWAEMDEQKALQGEVLEKQFEIAARNGKPINLHSRRCQRQVMERAVAFHRETGLNAQLHWFTQSKKLVRICNQEGIYVSVGPTAIDHPQTQEVALSIADELLLLETDAPVPVAGCPGHPQRVREVAELLARLKGISREEIAEGTAANFARFLGVEATVLSK
jgi:TatD DNase family protein